MCNYTNGLFYKFYLYEFLTRIKGIMIELRQENHYSAGAAAADFGRVGSDCQPVMVCNSRRRSSAGLRFSPVDRDQSAAAADSGDFIFCGVCMVRGVSGSLYP